jgi:selenocysteine lyase/cysteine desulfurase
MASYSGLVGLVLLDLGSRVNSKLRHNGIVNPIQPEALQPTTATLCDVLGQQQCALAHMSEAESSSSSSTTCDTTNHQRCLYRFHITGTVAHRRIVPLLQQLASNNKGSSSSLSYAWIDHAQHHQFTDHEDTATMATIDFLWENAPRRDTKPYRDSVRCYSHLPNGTAILDSKWVLGRLLKPGQQLLDHHVKNGLAVLETHCFRGPAGFASFCQQVGLRWNRQAELSQPPPIASTSATTGSTVFRDLWENVSDTCVANDQLQSCAAVQPAATKEPNLWVIKDAHANGAGGIWMVGPNGTAIDHLLTHGHGYVAQRYAWPPVLYRRRKCHVRVYALLTADGRAHVHRRCFLHVANDTFTTDRPQSDNDSGIPTGSANDDSDRHHHKQPLTTSTTMAYPDSVHITNCCANSHDAAKFAGEICADLQAADHGATGSREMDVTVGLAPFAPSIHASVAALAETMGPFVRGGQANGGFEYLGLDFILSYRSEEDSTEPDQPIAYLLEVNAPPSQDTATGLPHAEDLHDTVLRDLLTLWVLPCVTGAPPVCGGWHCVHDPRSSSSSTTTNDDTETDDWILPTKAAILNRIRWTLYERKCLAVDAELEATSGMHKATTDAGGDGKPCTEGNNIARFARTFFPYFSHERSKDGGGESTGPNPIFFENAGGTQVPLSVIQAMVSSLGCRHRSVLGKASVVAAKKTLSTILGASPSLYEVHLGSNASTLLATLADCYVSAGLLKAGDEIVLSSDNHQANVEPWLKAARLVGAVIRWWDPEVVLASNGNPAQWTDPTKSLSFTRLVSSQTRIIAIPHASNIVGVLYDLRNLRRFVDEATLGYGHMVVDGVAAVPHRYANVESMAVDWYVVSCHKMFGPHLGALCGRKATAALLQLPWSDAERGVTKGTSLTETKYIPGLEIGTMNYEACQGVCGLGQYMAALSSYAAANAVASTDNDDGSRSDLVLDQRRVVQAYRLMARVESALVRTLLEGLQRSTKVHILEGSDTTDARLPTVCMIHDEIRCQAIVQHCRQGGVTCRHGSFLSTAQLQALLSFARTSATTNHGSGCDDDSSWQVVRFSLVHYNTTAEVQALLAMLESIPAWF